MFTLCQNHWRTFVCSLMMLIAYLELLVYPYVTPVQVRPRKVPVLQHAKLACYSMEQDDEVKVTFSQQDNVKDKLDTLKKPDSVDGGSSWSLPPNAGDLTCMVFTLCQNHWRQFFCSLMMLIAYLELLVYPYVTPVQVRSRKVPVLQHAKLACYSMEQDDEVKVTFSQQDDVKDKLDTLKKTYNCQLNFI